MQLRTVVLCQNNKKKCFAKHNKIWVKFPCYSYIELPSTFSMVVFQGLVKFLTSEAPKVLSSSYRLK